MSHGAPQLLLPGHNLPFQGHFNHSISPYPAAPMQDTPVLFHPHCPGTREGGDRLRVIPFLKETLWESSGEGHPLSSLILLSVPTASFHLHRDLGLQTEGTLSCNVALRQLQAVIQARAQLEWELTQKQEDQWAKVAEQVDTTFREVPSQMSQADSMRLLSWFLSATVNPSAGPV